jgi:MscS family membrane protein
MLKSLFRFGSGSRSRPYWLSLVSCLLAIVLQISALGVPVIENPLEPPDTSTPQATLRSFIDNMNASHKVLMEAYQQYLNEPGFTASKSVREQEKVAEILFERSSRCLDLSKIPERLRRDAAIEKTLLLKEVLDRIKISDEMLAANQSANSKDISIWTIPRTEIEIAKVKEGERAEEFLFSPETISRASEFYKKVQELPYQPGATVGFYDFYRATPGSLLPPKWFHLLPNGLHRVYWDQTLWQWIAMVFLLILNASLSLFVFKKIQNKQENINPMYRKIFITTPALFSVFLTLLVAHVIDDQINITGGVLLFTISSLYFFVWLITAWIVFLFVSVIGEIFINYISLKDSKMNVRIVNIFIEFISFIVSSIVFLFGVQQIGINLLPVIASLGLGGAALALASKTTLENIISGIILFLDKPVLSGEWCSFGNKSGKIESIGLRSIRLRGTNGELIYIPNSMFLNLDLINLSRFEKRLFNHQIGLSYETQSDQLETILNQCRSLLRNHTQLIQDSIRVRLVGYSQSSIDLQIFVYVNTPDQNEFLSVQEELLIKIKQIVEDAGTSLAIAPTFP